MLNFEQNTVEDLLPAEWLVYEQPLTERVRTFLRLEFLFEECSHHLGLTSAWNSRAAISALLEISALLTRGDVRTEVLKELERCLLFLGRLQDSPEVDGGRLQSVLGELETLRRAMNGDGRPLGLGLKENEFLNTIKNRAAIPGGTCQFDLPLYHTWLTQPHARRMRDLQHWLDEIRPLRDTINLLMALTRESALPSREVAEQGMYLRMFDTPICPLVRVMVPVNSGVYPEISAGRQRITIHFLEPNPADGRPQQAKRDISFKLVCCQL
ncbi:MAG: cell division protein ZapD [Gammaproteobacteria bacterium]|nr:cell division protein ZapD [Gammaproteobacteria bacterium]MDE2345474.1 cell division protein ZapD [Gammaproteobacteria bacterium]